MTIAEKLENAKNELMSWEFNSYYKEQAQKAYPYFLDKGRRKQMVYYSEMSQECGLDPKGENFQRFIGHVCGALNQLSIADHDIILSALSINKSEQMPGVGLMHLYQDDLAVWSESVKEIFKKLANS